MPRTLLIADDSITMQKVVSITFASEDFSVVTAGSGDQKELAQIVPLVADKIAQNERATAYVCERRVCALPTNDPEVFATQIARIQPIPGSDKADEILEGHFGMGAMKK